MTWLLDGNVLVALAIDTHTSHQRVLRWFDSLSEEFATCAITEGTLLRLHMKFAVDGSSIAAWAALDAIHQMPDHRFWDAGFSYREIAAERLTGPAQVTDAVRAIPASATPRCAMFWPIPSVRRFGGCGMAADRR